MIDVRRAVDARLAALALAIYFLNGNGGGFPSHTAVNIAKEFTNFIKDGQ